MCTPSLCRNETIADINNTLFYKDPTYVAVAATAKHVSNNNKEYADILSIDWGRKASDLRDDDARSITKVMRCLLTTHVTNTPFLFNDRDTVFTAAQVNTCLGYLSMSENAMVWFQGGWWQHRVHDGVHGLLSLKRAELDVQHHQAENKDYAPYGQPEQVMEVQEGAGAAVMAREYRAGTPDTLSDTSESGQSECPSLGA